MNDSLEIPTSLFSAISSTKRKCVAPLCGAEIKRGDEIMIDQLSPSVYCHKCGVNLRFHRKRAVGRGEPEPVTFTDVEARFNQ
jgi:hypothetical protein